MSNVVNLDDYRKPQVKSIQTDDLFTQCDIIDIALTEIAYEIQALEARYHVLMIAVDELIKKKEEL